MRQNRLHLTIFFSKEIFLLLSIVLPSSPKKSPFCEKKNPYFFISPSWPLIFLIFLFTKFSEKTNKTRKTWKGEWYAFICLQRGQHWKSWQVPCLSHYMSNLRCWVWTGRQCWFGWQRVNLIPASYYTRIVCIVRSRLLRLSTATCCTVILYLPTYWPSSAIHLATICPYCALWGEPSSQKLNFVLWIRKANALQYGRRNERAL